MVQVGASQVLFGDCREVMATLDADSFDSVVTDPPYGIGFMGKGWDHGVPGVEFWEAALRVAKPGAYLVAFGGTRTFHRLACAIEDAGWELRDCMLDMHESGDYGDCPWLLGWAYGCGFPKSLNLDGGLGTALKPAWEPIILARKPIEGTVVENVASFGTGAMRIDECRIEGAPPSVPQPAFGVQNGNVFGFQTGSGRNGEMSNATGRWPANLIHDGSPEVVAMFPDSDGQSGAVTGEEPSSATNDVYGDFKGRPASEPRGDSGSAARFFFSGKATRADREQGLDRYLKDARGRQQDESRKPGDPGGDNPRNRGARERLNPHPCVKPTALMRWLCRLITPACGLVLDPFCGSGSTGKAAILERLRFVGIDRDPEYVEIARARIAWAERHVEPEQLSLLGG